MQKGRMIIGISMALSILAGCAKIDLKNSTDNNGAGEQVGRAVTQEEAVAETEASSSQQEVRELSKEELRNLTYFMNQLDNYGFLLSEYTVPEEVNLDEVLYNGAGMENEPMTEGERSSYLNALEGADIDTDCTKLKKSQITDFLNKKMGISYADIKKELSWIYLPEYDSFIHQHGDTNYTAFTCAKGTQVDETTYIIDCSANNEFASDCQVTLHKKEGDYQFVSNRFIDKIQNAKDIWSIEDQTFQVNLEELGDVMFTSYAPDTSVNEFADVTFALIKDGNTMFEFPGMEENNIREDCTFKAIKAIGFKDYNEDGRKEIIIINQYAPSAGADEEQWFDEVRVYQRRDGEKEFLLDADKSDYLNANHITGSIAEVAEQLRLFKNSDIEFSQITIEDACQMVKNVYFPTSEMYESSYDTNGNLSIVLEKWEQPWADGEADRPGETILFYDSETDDTYTFGCYRIFYEKDGKTVFATQTVGWYDVNNNTGEIVKENI